MKKQKPDGWAINSPESEWCGNDDQIHIRREKPIDEDSEGYLTVPIVMVPLDENNAMEDWIEGVRKLLVPMAVSRDFYAGEISVLLAELNKLRPEEK